MSKEDKKKQQLCAFISLIQTMGFDVIAFDSNTFKKKKKEKDGK